MNVEAFLYPINYYEWLLHAWGQEWESSEGKHYSINAEGKRPVQDGGLWERVVTKNYDLFVYLITHIDKHYTNSTKIGISS